MSRNYSSYSFGWVLSALLAFIAGLFMLSICLFAQITATPVTQSITAGCIYDLDQPTGSDQVTNGVWEMAAYATTSDGKWYWCLKSNIIQFNAQHPDLKIIQMVPSVHFMDGASGVPQKYFVFTSPVKVQSGESKEFPTELK